MRIDRSKVIPTHQLQSIGPEMLGQREAIRLMGMPSATMRLYATRLDLPPMHEEGRRRYAMGDLILIRMASILVERGYYAAAACRMVLAMKPQFERLVTEEASGARAWLAWWPEGEGFRWVVSREAGDVAFFLEQPGAAAIDVLDLLRQAMGEVLAAAKAQGHA